ncbi:MAG: DUF4878 domain-containing protein [Polyangiaceae bacterium]
MTRLCRTNWRLPPVLCLVVCLAGATGCGDKSSSSSPSSTQTAAEKPTAKSKPTTPAEPTLPRRTTSVRPTASASGSEPAQAEPTSAEDVIKQFYARLAKGDAVGAKTLYTKEALDEITAKMTAETFAQFMEAEIKHDAYKDLEIVKKTPSGAGFRVRYRVHYKDGSSVERAVDATRVEEHWRLGMIDDTF